MMKPAIEICATPYPDAIYDRLVLELSQQAGIGLSQAETEVAGKADEIRKLATTEERRAFICEWGKSTAAEFD